MVVLCRFIIVAMLTMCWFLPAGFAAQLSASTAWWEKSLLVASALFGAALFRIPLSLLEQKIGTRFSTAFTLVIAICALLTGWLLASNLTELILLSCLLGISGAWVNGQVNENVIACIVGMTVGLLGLPILTQWLGDSIFAWTIIPTTLALFVSLIVPISLKQTDPLRLADYKNAVKQKDVLWYSLFCTVSWGGLVGLLSYLNLLWQNHYNFPPHQAWALTGSCIAFASLLWWAGYHYLQHPGGNSLLTVLFVASGLMTLDLATGPSLVWSVVLIVALVGTMGICCGLLTAMVNQQQVKDSQVRLVLSQTIGCALGCTMPLILCGLQSTPGEINPGFLIFTGLAFFSAGGLIHLPLSSENSLPEGTLITQS